MRTVTREIEKKVKMPDGTSIVRRGTLTVDLPETLAEVDELVNGSAALWVAFGLMKYAQSIASSKLSGRPDNKELKKLLRQYRESYDTLTAVMEMAPADARNILLAKTMFASVAEYFQQFESAAPMDLDFTSSQFPQMAFATKGKRLFAIGDEDEDEDEIETETETEVEA